jgi:hypothetical protein
MRPAWQRAWAASHWILRDVVDVRLASAFGPDRLFFISRPNREHCANLRRDGRVTGAVLAIPLDSLGQTAGETHHRIYQIDVAGWVLYDEETSGPAAAAGGRVDHLDRTIVTWALGGAAISA